jgi:hypothetical protein
VDYAAAAVLAAQGSPSHAIELASFVHGGDLWEFAAGMVGYSWQDLLDA